MAFGKNFFKNIEMQPVAYNATSEMQPVAYNQCCMLYFAGDLHDTLDLYLVFGYILVLYCTFKQTIYYPYA